MVFQPGQSGNPGGSRGRKEFVDALHGLITLDWIDQKPPNLPAGEPIKGAHVLAHKLVSGALRDDWKPGEALAYMQEICDRAYGKPKQAITGGDEGDAPLKISIVRFTDGS